MGSSPNVTHTLFRLLMIATETRLAVIPYTIPELAEKFGYSRPTLDKTLNQLNEAGMIKFVRLQKREVTKSVVLTQDALNLHVTLQIMADALKEITDPTGIYLESEPMT